MSPATPIEDTIIAASPDTDSIGSTDDPQAGGLFSTGNETILSGIDSSIIENTLLAKASADAAKTSETNAAGSATSATTSATNASTSASNAAASATSAASDLALIGTSVTDAEAARDAAQAAQTAAETAETNAETAETNAATSATNASTSASTATTKAGEANTSATAAGNSATSASTSATSASNSASTATTKASEASTSATNAATSASTATTKASEASTSATNAASSASTATTKASEASSSAASASTSASTATTKASEAATSATNAASSETNAQTAQTAAELAETNAETAETNASASASTATTKAGEASTSATNAANSATSASGSASTATTKAGEASTSATNAATSETNAASSATSASNSASTATTKASEASTSASTATTKAGEASTSATNAATSETNAGTSETNAASSASAASTSETNAASSATSASGSASTATTKASEAATSASNASTSETNAASSATSASTSASNASSSATSAASAQTAAESARDATLAAYDNFDDRYLGVKSSDPSVDNDGNALIAGALYFNSTSESMQVYTGSAWVAAYVSGTGFAALSGATFTGDVTVPNLITSGNVDGRDVSADGTKLDGIASGATVPNNATITLAAGTNLSGGGDFTTNQSSNETITFNFSGTIPTATSDLTNDSGFITSADGGNAQTLDSLDSTQFLRSDQSGTLTGDLTLTSTADNGAVLKLVSNDPSDLVDFGIEGQIQFFAENDASQSVQYYGIQLRTADVTDGTEDGWLYFNSIANGTLTNANALGSDGSFYMLGNGNAPDAVIKWHQTKGTSHNVSLGVATPSADRTITLPDATGTVALTSGNVFSATKLQFSRTIAGNPFDGTSNIAIASTQLSDAASINASTLDSLDSTSFLRSDAADSFSGKIDATGTIEFAGGTTFDPSGGGTGTDTATDVGLALKSGTRIVGTNDGYIRSLIDWTSGSNLDIGQSSTGLINHTRIFGGNNGVELYENSTKRIETTSSGATVTGTLVADEIAMGDSNSGNSFANRIKLGASGDLKLFHSGTASLISDTGTGGLFITGSNAITFQSGDYGETYATFNDDGAVSLRHDNSVKFSTTSTGAEITGVLVSDGLDLGDNERIRLGASPTSDLQIWHDGTNSNIVNGTGSLIIADTSGDVKIQGKYGEQSIVANSDGSVELYHDNSKKLETTSDGASITGDLTLTSTDAGATDDPSLILYRNSSSPAYNDTLGEIIFRGNNVTSGQTADYASLTTKVLGTANNFENGELNINVLRTGAVLEVASFSFSEVRFKQPVKLDEDVNITFEGSSSNSHETVLDVIDPTADRTITLPDASGTVALTSDITGGASKGFAVAMAIAL